MAQALMKFGFSTKPSVLSPLAFRLPVGGQVSFLADILSLLCNFDNTDIL